MRISLFRRLLAVLYATGAAIPLGEVDESIEELGQTLVEKYEISPEILKLARPLDPAARRRPDHG